MGKIKSIGSRISMSTGLAGKLGGRQQQPKRADPELLTQQHKAWRKAVLERAGYRCQWMDGARRCDKAAPHHRMFADHIVERKDGGVALDPRNGQCLCGSHHTQKTLAARRERYA